MGKRVLRSRGGKAQHLPGGPGYCWATRPARGGARRCPLRVQEGLGARNWGLEVERP